LLRLKTAAEERLLVRGRLTKAETVDTEDGRSDSILNNQKQTEVRCKANKAKQENTNLPAKPQCSLFSGALAARAGFKRMS
jgi:hypothetical protein